MFMCFLCPGFYGSSGFFFGALTGPYLMLRFGGACGRGVGAFYQAPDKLPTTSVLFNVGIVEVEILRCNSLQVDYYCGSTEDLSGGQPPFSSSF
jgi:hypothetical protein